MSDRCYLVAHIDTSLSPPVLRGFGIYSESAGSLTCAQRRAWPLDVWSTEGRDYGEASERMREMLSDEGRSPLGHNPVLHAMVLEALAEPLEVVDPEPLPGGYVASRERCLNDPIAHALVTAGATAQQAADAYADALDEMRRNHRMLLERATPAFFDPVIRGPAMVDIKIDSPSALYRGTCGARYPGVYGDAADGSNDAVCSLTVGHGGRHFDGTGRWDDGEEPSDG
jgi:hypothetical protein